MLALIVVLGGDGAPGPDASPSWRLVIRDERGMVLHDAVLPDGRFALRYRNSVYRSLAEEHFLITRDGRIALVELAADEPAVLAEYYGVDAPMRPGASGSALGSSGVPSEPMVIDELPVAATDLGRRTLLVDGRPAVELWRLVPDTAPVVTLSVEAVP